MKRLLFILLIFCCCSPQENNWDNLIVNNSLEGWHIFQDNGSKKGWSVKNNTLIFDTLSGLESGNDDASILSDKMYSSFEIIFDWKIEKGGNSGFMWGVREDNSYKFPYQTGLEIQIIDIAAYDSPREILGGEIELNNILTDLNEKKHYLGAVYDLYPPKITTPPNPAGEWNTYHILIDQKNNYGFVKLNDLIINKFQLRGEQWDSLYSKSKFSKSYDYPYLGEKRWYDFGKFSKGYICFQDHPGKSYFKNIKIRKIVSN
jgi:hypothetical protein